MIFFGLFFDVKPRYYVSNVKGRIQLDYAGPKPTVAAFEVNTILEIINYPYVNNGPNPDQFLIITSAIAVPNQSTASIAINGGTLQVRNTSVFGGVYYQASSVASISGVIK